MRRAESLSREVALEDSVLDEDVFLGGRAFVVDVKGAAAVGHGSVIDDGDLGAGDALADEAGEGGGLFAVEVGFEAVADGFVEEDSGPAGAEDDFHVSGGGGDGVELEDGLTRGFVGVVLGGFVALEEVEFDAASSAGGAFGGLFAVLGDDEDVEAGKGLGVGGEGAVGGGDEDAAEFVGVAGADLDDARIEGAGGFVGAHD